jgi:hypothetical protein
MKQRQRPGWALCGRPGRGQGLLDFNLEEPSPSHLNVVGEGQRVLDVNAELLHRALLPTSVSVTAHDPGHIPDGQSGKEDVGDRVQPVGNALVLPLKEITCPGK